MAATPLARLRHYSRSRGRLQAQLPRGGHARAPRRSPAPAATRDRRRAWAVDDARRCTTATGCSSGTARATARRHRGRALRRRGGGGQAARPPRPATAGGCCATTPSRVATPGRRARSPRTAYWRWRWCGCGRGRDRCPALRRRLSDSSHCSSGPRVRPRCATMDAGSPPIHVANPRPHRRPASSRLPARPLDPRMPKERHSWLHRSTCLISRTPTPTTPSSPCTPAARWRSPRGSR